MKLIFLFLLLPLIASAQDGCKIEKKLNKSFVKCLDRAGFLDSDEKIPVVAIEYETDGKTSRFDLNDISASDLILESKIKDFLVKAGIVNPEQVKIIYLSMESETPLYKDPETKVLASGCHYTYAPTIISYGKGTSCGDFICNGQIECKTGKKLKKSDAFCRATISKEGAACPMAFGCLSDSSISIEKYIPGGSRGIRSSGGDSKGSQR